MDLDKVLEAAIEAARAAGEIALKYYRGGFDVVVKPDQSPVTQADREAEQIIIRALSSAFPEHGFLGEEFGAQGNPEVRWIIDPIDGTRNFVRRIPHWAVLIALEERGEITTGVALNPVSGELYTARKGQGAFANGEQMRVSHVGTLERALLVHASLKVLRRERQWEGFIRLVDATERQRGFGDYLDYVLVAEGKAELVVEADLKPWDLAPMKLLIEEAGGRFTDFTGQPTIYSGTALATNGKLHARALALLNGS
ncbi:MAG: histidinol phosphate phosphatase [Candidatus Rokubacteria bacterium]|nr:histidinol phosphate phosphatase [Candidatus Rokubacteria bacterium]